MLHESLEIFIRVPNIFPGSSLLGLVLLHFGHRRVLPWDRIYVARFGVGCIIVVT